jgi:hypothetical protein
MEINNKHRATTRVELQPHGNQLVNPLRVTVYSASRHAGDYSCHGLTLIEHYLFITWPTISIIWQRKSPESPIPRHSAGLGRTKCGEHFFVSSERFSHVDVV